MSKTLDPIVAEAIRKGILPEGAGLASPERRNWPTIVLSFLGAWLVVLPFLAVIFMLFGKWVMDGPGAVVLGTVFLAGSTMVLRSSELPAFVEHLAFPGLLIGGVLLGIFMFAHMPSAAAALTLAAVSLGTCRLVKRDWVRILLGGAGCALTIACVAALPSLWERSYGRFLFGHTFFLAGLQFVTAAWAVAEWWSRRAAAGGSSEENAIWLDRLLLGWAVAALLGLSVGSERTFLLSEALSVPGGSETGMPALAWAGYLPFAVSTGMGLLGVALLVRSWRSLAAAWFVMPAVALAGLSMAMPGLGPCLLVATLAAVERRWGLATAAGLAALWVLGGFYYSLEYPLAIKAGILFCAALVLAVPAWLRLRGHIRFAPGSVEAEPAPALARPLLALGCAAVLAVVNIGIWQKERLIGDSRVLYVELAPVDPRSLMQGDFMRLAFRLPPQDNGAPRAGLLYAVGTVDQRDIVTFTRYQENPQVRPGEVAMRLAYKHGQWILVTDAWFFEEGSAATWAGARYGEFRVDRKGKALLVGLRGPARERLSGISDMKDLPRN